MQPEDYVLLVCPLLWCVHTVYQALALCRGAVSAWEALGAVCLYTTRQMLLTTGALLMYTRGTATHFLPGGCDVCTSFSVALIAWMVYHATFPLRRLRAQSGMSPW